MLEKLIRRVWNMTDHNLRSAKKFSLPSKHKMYQVGTKPKAWSISNNIIMSKSQVKLSFDQYNSCILSLKMKRNSLLYFEYKSLIKYILYDSCFRPLRLEDLIIIDMREFPGTKISDSWWRIPNTLKLL